MAETSGTPGEGEVLGRFRLVHLLDSGGMGDVWLAERADGQFRQTVAVKVFRTTNALSEGVERFLQERQTLARLEHPSIARLIDGGTTSIGTPYLVMEWVDGIPIDAFCETNGLTRKQRIALFQLVCDAVHFAHQSLVIHRDLKPANILVSPSGRPKLLDFGIAQWSEQTADSTNMAGPANRRALCTPEFASPEQLSGGHCTTASDVYSLGVILRRICFGDPPNLQMGPITKLAGYSALGDSRMTSDGDALASNADNDTLCVDSLPQLENPLANAQNGVGGPFCDDLNWIIRKAMQRDPALRYATANELSIDLGRMLAGYPVGARGMTVAYQSIRFIQRNRLLSGAALLFALVLGCATIATLFAWKRASFERDAAQAATRFIGGILTSTSPFARRGTFNESVSAEVLALTSRQAESQLKSLPAVEIQVRVMLADAYASLWLWRQVHSEVARALRLLAATAEPDPEIEARSLTLLGRAQTWLRVEGAVSTQRRALELRRRLFGHVHEDVAESQIALGFALWRLGTQEQSDEADRSYREGIETYRRAGVTCSADFARALFSYSEFRKSRGLKDVETFDTIREAAECYKSLPDPPDRYRIAAQSSFAGVLLGKRMPAKALAELRSLALLMPGEIDGEEPARHMFWTLGHLEELGGDVNRAFHAYRRALGGECLARVSSGPQSRKLRLAAQMARAAERTEDLLAVLQEMLPSIDDPSVSWDQEIRLRASMVAALALGTSFREESCRLIDTLIESQKSKHPDDVHGRLLLQSVRARADVHRGDYDSALKTWLHCLQALKTGLTYEDLRVQSIIKGIVHANEALGKKKAADQYRQLLLRWE